MQLLCGEFSEDQDGILSEALDMIYSYAVYKYKPEETALICKEMVQIAEDANHVFCDSGERLDYEQLQSKLFTLNEKQDGRKQRGVYYTPDDAVQFILECTVKLAYNVLGEEMIGDGDWSNIPVEDFCYSKTVFDPTCGTGAFLLAALKQKLDMLEAVSSDVSTKQVKDVVTTICGNDINPSSTKLTKMRLALHIADRYGAAYIAGISSAMKAQFSAYDYVSSRVNHKKYDVIVGNPPWVTDPKCGIDLPEKYGNIYGNVMVNSARQLSECGAVGFVVPISYSSTQQMCKLREVLSKLATKQYILSYSDRPCQIFHGAHQKCNIVIASKICGQKPQYYTSKSICKYKSDRHMMFHNVKVYRNSSATPDIVQKFQSSLDEQIYRKVQSAKGARFWVKWSTGTFLSVRGQGRFWVKSFRRPIVSPGYNVFCFTTEQERDWMYCVVNSSLFWWFWECVSDGWHVSRDLNGFHVVTPPGGGYS